MSNEHNTDPLLVVGIGASAGGLAAIKEFLRHVPASSGMAIIIVQHLDPSHESLLGEILSKISPLPVITARHSEKLCRDHLYVMPENRYLEVKDGYLSLIESGDNQGRRQVIDHFFRSLSTAYGDRCAGIVLSGAGSDGTAGLRELKAAGGLALAQDPETAEYRSMPSSSIQANVVDMVLPVRDLPSTLRQYMEHPMTLRDSSKEGDDGAVVVLPETLDDLNTLLQTYENFDLKLYKPTTVKRRIARRMSLMDISRYEKYLELLRESEVERDQLTKDLLINVTDFFRDKEAFHYLESRVLPDLLRGLSKQEEFRVWIPGCASGEEAYSIAILLLEARATARFTNSIRIFATDIDEDAIQTARAGVYPASIASEVPSAYLNKYFTKIDDSHFYKVHGNVRDLISFASQNVVTDPPFNRMHLICCRNLLIYLNKDVQEGVLDAFYFALEPEGCLFLGSSESLGKRSELFQTLSKKWRLYKKIPGQRNTRFDFRRVLGTSGRRRMNEGSYNLPARRQVEGMSRADRMRVCLLDSLAQPVVLVDEQGTILYAHGDLRRYLTLPQGEPRADVIQHIIKPMRSRIRSGLYKARNSRQAVSVNCVLFEEDSKNRRLVNVVISAPKENNFIDGLAMSIAFYEQHELTSEDIQNVSDVDDAIANRDLERELAETKEELQNTVEELETNTEELKASHEEVLSTNEELQSSNEELEASSEELRSLNEELRTVNGQLKEKVDELNRANDDVENFFASTDLPTIFLNTELKIQRFTPAAERLLRIGTADVNRHICEMGRDLIDDELINECNSVLQNLQPIRREKQDAGGNWFMRQITPYRTDDRHIEGVVLVFQDITELRRLYERAEGREKQQSVVARLGMLALGGADPEDLMHQAVREVAHTLNAEYCKVLRYNSEEENFLMVAGVGWREGLVGKATVPSSEDSQAGYTLLTKEPVIVSDLGKEKRFRGPHLLTDHHVVSGMSCLINHTEPPYGVLGVHTKDQRDFTNDDANFLLSVANMLSTAIHTRDARRKLNESEDRFRTLANSIPQLAWMTDKTGDIVWYNSQWYDYTGSNYEEMKGWGWRKAHHPDHVDRVVEHIQHSFECGKEWEDTFPLRSKSGEYRWFLSRAKPIYDQDGSIVRWFGTNTDITEQLSQEKELRESREKLRLAMSTNTIGTFEYRFDGKDTKWDGVLMRIWGVKKGEELNQDIFWEGVHIDDRSRVKKAIDGAKDANGDGHYHCIYRVKNRIEDRVSWVEASGQSFFENGIPVRMVGLVIDVTEEETTRERLAKSEEKLRYILATNQIGVWELDLKSMSATRSIEHDKIFGYKSLQPNWTFDSFMEHIHADDREHVIAQFEAAKKNAVWDFECRIQRVDTGDERWIWANGQVKRDDANEPERMVGLVQDVTDRKLLENELRNAIDELKDTDQKKNDFLSILGHELRNPLAALSSGISIIEDDYNDQEILDLMKYSIKSMSKLLDDLLDLRRVSQNKIQIEMHSIALHEVLRKSIRMNRGLFDDHKQTIETEIDDGLWIQGDEVRLDQVFTNLLVNAAKYTPRGGHLKVSGHRIGRIVHVIFEDNGIGIDADMIDRIFNPFYQIKPEGKASSGLGIGLALCQKLIELHGGDIKVESPGKDQGSTFTVRIPFCLPDKDKDSPPVLNVSRLSTNKIAVLLIEDNENILRAMPHQLKKLNCEVSTAKNGEEGLNLAESLQPDVILVDIGLPDMDGHEVGRRLRESGFRELLVAISGYSHGEVQEKSRQIGFDFHLAKPVSMEELSRVLSESS